MGKIAAFIFDLSQGGAQGVFVTVVNYLYANDNDVEVVVQNLNNPIYKSLLNPNIKIVDLHVQNAREMLPKLIRYVKNNNFQVGLSFSPEISVDLLLSRLITRRSFKIVGRCINTLSLEYSHATSFFRKHITNRLFKLLYYKVDLVIAQSQGMATDLENNYKFPQEKIIVINNALGAKFESVLNERVFAKRENYIVYAGRLERQKGLPMLLDAFCKLTEKNIELYIIGSGSMLRELEGKCDSLGISHRVHFIPHTTKIEEYYKSAKATVLCSYYEGFPNVLVESLACGTPVVSFDLPSGPSEIIINGQNGFLVNYLDVNDFANKLDIAINTEWNHDVIFASVDKFRGKNILPQYLDAINDLLR